MDETYRHFALELLADGAWAAVHRTHPPTPDAWAVSNAGIVDLGDRTLVLDTFLTTAAADELRAAAETLTGRPPELVVLTHTHNDHAWGADRFPAATLVAASGARAELAADGAGEIESYREAVDERLAYWVAAADGGDPVAAADAPFFLPYWEGIAATLPGLRLRPPDLALDGELEIHGSTRRVALRTVERAHTGGDLVLVLPDERIVFCGDLLFTRCHPWLGDGDLAGLRRALAMLAALDGLTYVPGHGPVGGPDALAALGGYLDTVEWLAAEGGDAAMPPAFGDWALGRFFAANVAFARSDG